MVCLEIDLSKPLSRGFWIGDDVYRVFIVVQYERLPTFYYNCGLIGYGRSCCSCSVTSRAGSNPPPSCSPERIVVDSTLVPLFNDQRMDDVALGPDHSILTIAETAFSPPPKMDFGPCLLVS